MEDAFSYADELGPTRIVHVYEPTLGLRGALVVDNVAAGPAIGGLRMAPDVTTEECVRLARAMTLKNAAAGLAHGGGKSVLMGDPRMPRERKEPLIRAMARALRGSDDYIFGPDMGTDETCMAWVQDEIGRAVGLPEELGGIPLDQLGATGFGLLHATERTLARLGIPLAGTRVVVQGFGAVGLHAARLLAERGAVLVAAGDSRGAIHDPQGLDVAALAAEKRQGRSVGEHGKGQRIDADGLVAVECEVWIPAARGDVIHEGNAERLRTRAVICGANLPTTSAAERILHQRGIVCVPDFIANAGGVICAAMEYHGATRTAAFQAIEERIRRNVDQVLEEAQRSSAPPRHAALELAVAHVRRAMSLRRFSLF